MFKNTGISVLLGLLAIGGVYLFITSGDALKINPDKSSAAVGSAALTLDFGKQLTASNCNGVGAPIINVTQKITNDADSGQAGNYWAFDTFNRKIQVWKTSTTGSYCAVVQYDAGSFKAQAGQTSPGNTGPLSGKESGPIQGGYVATISNATLLSDPTWPTHGSVGTTDYQCDISGSCPGAVNWTDQYFEPGYNFDQPWWGWIYRAGGNHTWVNSIDGNHGDVL